MLKFVPPSDSLRPIERLVMIRNRVEASRTASHAFDCHVMEATLRIGVDLKTGAWRRLTEQAVWKNSRIPTERPKLAKRVRWVAFFAFGAHAAEDQKRLYDLVQAALIIYREKRTADGLAERLIKRTVSHIVREVRGGLKDKIDAGRSQPEQVDCGDREPTKALPRLRTGDDGGAADDWWSVEVSAKADRILRGCGDGKYRLAVNVSGHHLKVVGAKKA